MGLPKGYKHKKKAKPNIRIKSVKINFDEPIGKQLHPFRLMKKYTLKEMEESTGWHHANISHFEHGKVGLVGNSLGFARKYAKALGIKQFIFLL